MVKRDKCMEIVNEDSKVFLQAARVTYFPLAVKSAHGAIVVDADGNEYIDLLASAASINVGHSHPKVVEAITQQVKEFINYTSGYVYHKPEELWLGWYRGPNWYYCENGRDDRGFGRKNRRVV